AWPLAVIALAKSAAPGQPAIAPASTAFRDRHPGARMRSLSLALLFGVASFGHAADPARKHLNVLFVPVDDLKPAIACFGDPHAKTPNLARLAARGTVFLRAYCQQAVCSPSRSSLLTGRRPDTTKVYDLVTHFRTALPDVVTLPQHFKNNGYFVQGMGKIYHGGYDDPPSWSVPWTNARARAYASAENQGLVRRRREKAIAEGSNEDGIQTVARAAAYEGGSVPDNSFPDGALAD